MNEKAEDKIIISPAQGLLILIEAALKKEKLLEQSKTKSADSTDSESFSSNDTSIASPSSFFSPSKSFSNDIMDKYQATTTMSSESLIKLYVLGASDSDLVEYNLILSLLHSDLPSIYEVSKTDDSINNDITRRYFETQLAVNSLEHGLKELSADSLKSHQTALLKFLFYNEPELNNKVVFQRFARKITQPDMQELKKKIMNKDFVSEFSQSDWEKMDLLVNCWIYGFMINNFVKLPMDLYHDERGLFSEINRGRADRDLVDSEKDDPTQYSQNLGIINSLTPTPAYSKVQSSEVQEGFVLSDVRTFVPGSRWVDYNFLHLVHPFVNSLSGTMLVHLRCLLALKNNSTFKDMDKLFDKDNVDKLALYLRLFSALLIYGPGGHSWFEFTYPITMREVKENFEDIPGFDTLNMETIVYKNNLPAVNQSIQETIDYNRVVLARRLTQHELLSSPRFTEKKG